MIGGVSLYQQEKGRSSNLAWILFSLSIFFMSIQSSYIFFKTFENDSVSTQAASINESKDETVWIGSPVVQNWEWDPSINAWKTLVPYDKSMNSRPSIQIGLKEDGTIVWKRVSN